MPGSPCSRSALGCSLVPPPPLDRSLLRLGVNRLPKKIGYRVKQANEERIKKGAHTQREGERDRRGEEKRKGETVKETTRGIALEIYALTARPPTARRADFFVFRSRRLLNADAITPNFEIVIWQGRARAELRSSGKFAFGILHCDLVIRIVLTFCEYRSS